VNELLHGTQRIQKILYRARASLLKRQQRQAGMALPMAMITALLVIVGVAIVGTRSLSAWIAQIGQSQNRDARDAAEYGFSKLMAQLNQPQNSFLLVSKGNEWRSVTYGDLGSCGVGDLDRVDGVVGGDLLDRLAATDRLHGDPGLELGTVGAALAHRWVPLFRGGAPPQRLTMGAVQESQTTSFPIQPA